MLRRVAPPTWGEMGDGVLLHEGQARSCRAAPSNPHVGIRVVSWKGTREAKAIASFVETNSGRTVHELLAQLLPEPLLAAGPIELFQISTATSTDDCISSTSVSTNQLRRTQTSFKGVLELRRKPFEPIRLGFVGQYLGL